MGGDPFATAAVHASGMNAQFRLLRDPIGGVDHPVRDLVPVLNAGFGVHVADLETIHDPLLPAKTKADDQYIEVATLHIDGGQEAEHAFRHQVSGQGFDA